MSLKSLYLSSETVAAIYRAVIAGLKRNLAGLSAICTNCIVHLTRTAVAARITVILAFVAAGLTALGLVCEAFFSIKLLLAGGKSEFLSAILADEGLVIKHVKPL